MKTHTDITDPLERKILANALLTLRNIGRPKVKSKWFVYISAWDGLAMDECYVDTETWKLKKVEYDKYVGKKVKHFVINVN